MLTHGRIKKRLLLMSLDRSCLRLTSFQPQAMLDLFEQNGLYCTECAVWRHKCQQQAFYVSLWPGATITGVITECAKPICPLLLRFVIVQ